MTTRCSLFSVGLLIGLAFGIPLIAHALTPPSENLPDEDSQRVVELNMQIGAALEGDRWDNVIARAEELRALQARVRGPNHFETVTAEWSLKAFRRVTAASKEDRVAFASGFAATNNARELTKQGKFTEARVLIEKVLETNRRLLGDDAPMTATSFNDLALNCEAEGRYAQARALHEKALEIKRRLLGDDNLDTARSYNNLARNLDAQGKHAKAEPLLEKALELKRRLLGDDHPDTALGYNNVAGNLDDQGKHTLARPLHEKALEIRRLQLGDEHPETAGSYNNLAAHLKAQGKYAEAQPVLEKALKIRLQTLHDDHPLVALSYNNLAHNFNAQGKYTQAREQWQLCVKVLDAGRLYAAFTGLERSATGFSPRPALAAVLARLGAPAEAWQALEEHLGRGLLDELVAREDMRLTPLERDRLGRLNAELEQLDRLVKSKPNALDQAGRAKQFDDLKRRRARASIALGEFQNDLAAAHGALAGHVAKLPEIQAVLPADTALIAWVDLTTPGPSSADMDGEHWGVVVRSAGVPAWIPMPGTGPNASWTTEDSTLSRRVRKESRTTTTSSQERQPAG